MRDDATGYLRGLLTWHQTAPRDLARMVIAAEPARLYALVDVAFDPELLDLLDASGEEFCALDETRERDDLGPTAPVLVAITPGAATLATLIEEAWATGAVMFVASEGSFRDVYRHALSLAGVDPAVTALRFWDPAALRAVMDADDDASKRRLFGPITAFLVESSGPDALLRYALSERGVTREEIPLR